MKCKLALLLTVITLFHCSSGPSEIILFEDSSKQILSFAFRVADNHILENDIIAIIDESAKTITADITSGTAMISLVPEIAISNLATIAPNLDTVQDFSKPVEYIVTAKDGTQVTYTVTLNIISRANQILSFVFKKADNQELTEDIIATIDQETNEIKAILPHGIDSRYLVPTIEFSEKASVSPESGVQQDFSRPSIYFVVAESGLQNFYRTNILVKLSDKERNALKAIHLANPLNTLNWDFDDENNVSWDGVQIINGKVIRLFIPNGHNISTIPTEIGDLVHLTALAIRENPQIESFPESLKNLVNLEILDLSQTGLTSFPPGITYMTKLKNLVLNNNTIGMIPTDIKNLVNLEVLIASSNALQNVPVEITTLNNLRVLHFSSNSGISSIPTEIENLISLVQLNLHGCSLATIPTTIGNLTKLQILDIAANNLTSIPSEIGNLTNLNVLEIWDNSFTTIPQKVCDLEKTGTRITKDDNVTCN